MFVFFDYVLQFISLIIDFIIGSIKAIGLLFQYFIDGLSFIFEFGMLLPPYFMPFIFSCFLIVIIRFILNRGD